MSVEEILYEIGKRGEWRVIIRPLKFEKEHIKFEDCKSLIEQCQVILRGWNYPHYHDPGEVYGGIAFGDDFVQCITNHKHYKEIWRMHQSGLFFHRFACTEDWLPQTADRNVLDIYSTLYRITEIFQFASRLAIKNVFDNQVNVSIELVRMKNRALVFMYSEALSHSYEYLEDKLSYSRQYTQAQLVAGANNLALECVQSFFMKFGWLSSNMENILKTEQDVFVGGKYKIGSTGIRYRFS